MKHQHNAGIVAVAREIRIVQLCPRPQGHVGTLTFAKSVPETIPPDIPRIFTACDTEMTHGIATASHRHRCFSSHDNSRTQSSPARYRDSSSFHTPARPFDEYTIRFVASYTMFIGPLANRCAPPSCAVQVSPSVSRDT
jgi:hypothetical protein